MRSQRWSMLVVLCGVLGMLLNGKAVRGEDEKPLKALIITGGCCHDYAAQKKILSEGLGERIAIEFDVIHQGGSTTNTKIPVYVNPDWYAGYDVIIHNECFAGVTDPEWTKKIIKPHHDGLPAVVIHCAMHSYRDKTEEWFKFVGVTSHRHGAHYPYEVVNLQPRHFAMEQMGARWKTPQGELYLIEKVWPNTKPLAAAYSRDTKKMEVCAWTNEYGKGRVFGTTIGHHNETMRDPHYLDMVARGVLWATKRDEHKYLKTPEVLVQENLAEGKKARASAEQDNTKQAKFAFDGDVGSRWCASPKAGEWLQVDMGKKPVKATSINIDFEFADGAYQYVIEVSDDGENWKTLIDRRDFKPFNGTHEMSFPEQTNRYYKLTITGMKNGQWASVREFRVHHGKGEIKRLEPVTVEEDRAKKAKQYLNKVRAPEGFEVNMFAVPPDINYPVCVTASVDGVVFVGVDENGSLDRARGRGRIIKCVDTDGDGKADKFTTFALIESPRGLIYDGETLYVMHPPDMMSLRDTDGDGIADERNVLVKGLGFDLDFRGADHTTNAHSLGIDGWLYVAVGDYGFMNAVGADGTKLKMRGGGVVRVRPDGSELEIVARGLRNIYDVSVDSKMNLFTRDNTNDGGGWNVRFSHIIPMAHYGYPSLYKNFNDEIMQPLKDYGGGSGTGAAYVQDSRLPEKYQSAVLTCDWGRSAVYFHDVKRKGAIFVDNQETFVTMPRPTDADADGLGNIYITSWMGGGFNFKNPEVGFVVQLRKKGLATQPKLNLDKAGDAALVGHLLAESHAVRMQAQQELLRRDDKAGLGKRVFAIAGDKGAALESRIAALYTYKQLLGAGANAGLVKLVNDDAIKPYVLKVLVDRKSELDGVLVGVYEKALASDDAQVRLEGLIGLGRLGAKKSAGKVFGLLRDRDAAVRHIAVKVLVELNAHEVVIGALKSSDEQTQMSALRVMREMHDAAVVEALSKRLGETDSRSLSQELLTTMIRLYHLEGEWTKGWWGTRPDTSGPYYQREKWEQSEVIEKALVAFVNRADWAALEHVHHQLGRHKVKLKSLDGKMKEVADGKGKKEMQKKDQVVVVPAAGKVEEGAVGLMKFEEVLKAVGKGKGDVALGKKLFTQQGCAVCHTVSDKETPKGPFLGQVGAKYSREEILQSIIEPGKVVSQGFETTVVKTKDGKEIAGFVSKEAGDEIEMRDITGKAYQIKKSDIAKREHLPISMMPPGLVSALKPAELRALLSYLENMK